MQTEILTALISSIIGGLLVAVVNHLFTRRKTNAEIEKLKAETQKIMAEGEKIRSEMMHLNTALSEASYYDSTQVTEKVVYDGRHGILGQDITSEFDKYTIQQGVLVIQDSSASLVLRLYTYDGKEFEFIPKNEIVSGKRRFHISCELKVVRSPYDVNIFMWDCLEEEDSVDDRQITITQSEWTKTDLYFRVRNDMDYLVHILAERASGTGSLQIRNLVVAERIS